jgi:hypothetical protein
VFCHTIDPDCRDGNEKEPACSWAGPVEDDIDLQDFSDIHLVTGVGVWVPGGQYQPQQDQPNYMQVLSRFHLHRAPSSAHVLTMDVLHVCSLYIWKQQISKLLRRSLVSLFIIVDQELWVTYSLSARSLSLCTLSLSLSLSFSLSLSCITQTNAYREKEC